MALADVSDTGLGATFTFSSTTFAARITSIQGPTWSIDSLDDSTLSTTAFKEYISSDLAEPGEVTVEIMFPTSLDEPTIGGTPETATLTFPLRSGAGGEGTAATLAGTGYFSENVFPALQIGTIQKGTYKFKFDGKTGPAFTKSVAA